MIKNLPSKLISPPITILILLTMGLLMGQRAGYSDECLSNSATATSSTDSSVETTSATIRDDVAKDVAVANVLDVNTRMYDYSDGARDVYVTGGGWVHYYPDGARDIHNPDGSMTLVNPDGTISHDSSKNGLSGSTHAYPDGAWDSKTVDGGWVHTYPDGSKDIHSPDGSSKLVNPQGVVTYDSSKTTNHAS